MTRVEIATRLHKFADIVDDGDLARFSGARHYVIGDDLFRAMGREDVQRSIAAMIEAEMARLPFPKMLVEFSPVENVTRFILLAEAPGGFDALTAMMTNGGLATVPRERAMVRIQAGKLAVQNVASEPDAQAITLGASFGLLMLNIRGVEKRRIEPISLNAARTKRGKKPIPSHTVMRIGVVYDRAGKEVRGTSVWTHVYMRAGHARHQAYGKDWSQHRWIYVWPQLVNYREGDPEPTARTKIVKMG